MIMINTPTDKGTGTMSDVNRPNCQKKYKVDYFHVDLNNRIKLSSLFNYMQDIAGIHANELKCGYDILSKLGITWIMLRAKIQMQSYPCWGDIITVKTSTNGVDKLCAVREFEFIDADGRSIGYAITYWILYDIAGHKVVRMNHSGFELPEHLTVKYGDYEKLTRIKAQGELKSESTRRAQYNDIDTNIHVNNARYIEWLTDAVYEDVKADVDAKENVGADVNANVGADAKADVGADVDAKDQMLIKSLHVGFTSSVKLGDSVNIKKFIFPDKEKDVVLRVYKDDIEYLQAEIELN